ncbi:hypothetical protein HMPREF9318_01227 [Streptococcus urinalis FB127-CNA-2]|uniref:CppA protein n=1 Tax=Streptococcus urinalis 2285-97 TaxID=764291 RepID=G5KC75_9STRE|nr:CppA N-terminal domain-containing protein [Streptococcus urinalis]EHJ57307.1 hypothetical protein STRUR_0389 [Streptococcus urinalis 2285-97]EKS19705.1 hypothetical protein HMPREF9318_01227 [Streptococcus urinalis FB127-CNA-2]VEF31282.1 C3-degrading proteinase [Streptococcus urinalis]
MTLFDKVVFKTPVVRVNNRDLNIAFYESTLGFKLISEENAIAIFSSWENPENTFIIEESPEYRTRAVDGTKKLAKIVVKTSKKDIEQLLARDNDFEKIFQGQNGYAFEAVSPEGDHFILHCEDNLNELKEINKPEIKKEEHYKGISHFTFESITLNVLNKEESQSFYQDLFDGQFPIHLDFQEAEGDDLQIEPNETWDIEILENQVPSDFDLLALKKAIESKGYSAYLDAKETVLVLSDLSNIEIWFQK